MGSIMAAIDFPDNPTVGQSFSAGTRTWLWDGTVWANTTARDFVRSVSDTAPTDPQVGDEWFNSSNGRLYNYYDGYWIEIGAAIGGEDGKFLVSSTAPLNPEQGDAWFNSETAKLYVYYDSFWVEASPPAEGPQGPAGPAGSNGVDGVDGTNGINGVNGVDGVDGQDGVAAATEPLSYDENTRTISIDLSSYYTSSETDSAISTAVSDKSSIDGAETLTNKTLSNHIVSGQTRENVLTSETGFAGYTYDVIANGVQYIAANSTANGTINFRGDSTTSIDSFASVGQSITCALLITNGSNAYYPTAFQIDGVAVTPKWQNASAPTGGNANSIDTYTFTIIKTASATYTLLASQTRFA